MQTHLHLNTLPAKVYNKHYVCYHFDNKAIKMIGSL